MLGQLLRAGPGRHGRLRPVARLADVKIVKIEGRYWALLQREGLSRQVHVCRRSAGLLFFRVIVGVISTTADEKCHDMHIIAVICRKLTLVGSNCCLKFLVLCVPFGTALAVADLLVVEREQLQQNESFKRDIQAVARTCSSLLRPLSKLGRRL